MYQIESVGTALWSTLQCSVHFNRTHYDSLKCNNSIARFNNCTLIYQVRQLQGLLHVFNLAACQSTWLNWNILKCTKYYSINYWTLKNNRICWDAHGCNSHECHYSYFYYCCSAIIIEVTAPFKSCFGPILFNLIIEFLTSIVRFCVFVTLHNLVRLTCIISFTRSKICFKIYLPPLI